MNSYLLQVCDSLDDDTPLFRTLDFFSAMNIIHDQQLMFSRADTFDDKNEGIEHLLRQLEHTTPGGGCGGMGWTDSLSAKSAHDELKRSHYVSCWSLNPESVAMWSLYSPDRCSVRISTTVGQLKSVAENFIRKYDFLRFTTEDLGNYMISACDARISPVKYESVLQLTHRVSRRAAARIRLSERLARQGAQFSVPQNIDHPYWRRERERQIVQTAYACELKDESFSHEKEVRVIVRLGKEAVTDNTLEKQKWLYAAIKQGNVEMLQAIRQTLSFWRYVYSEEMPQREFRPVPEQFIKSVAIDPRCPPHKTRYIRNTLKNAGLNVVTSTCFGYIPDTFEIFPDR